MAADGAMPVPVTVEQAVRWADTLPGWFLHRLIIVTEHIGLMSRIPGFTWPKVGWSNDDFAALRQALQSLFRYHVDAGDLNGLYKDFRDTYDSLLEKGIQWRHEMNGDYETDDIHTYLAVLCDVKDVQINGQCLTLNVKFVFLRSEFSCPTSLEKMMRTQVFLCSDYAAEFPIVQLLWTGVYMDIQINSVCLVEGQLFLNQLRPGCFILSHQRHTPLVAPAHDFLKVQPSESNWEGSESECADMFDMSGGPAVCGK